MRRLAVTAILVLAAAALAGALVRDGGAAGAATGAGDTVTVTGIGVATGTPDTALISAGVESTGATARAALAANAAEMNKVLAALRAAGARNVGTQSVSLSPRTNGQGRPNGFVATNIASGTIAVERAGALIDAAVDAGANTVYGPSLTSTEAKSLYRRALRAAVGDARERAAILAAAAGRKLGRVVQMTEGANGAIPLQEKAAAADGTPIVAGEQETTASVTVTFALG